jgi:uncharacterized protein
MIRRSLFFLLMILIGLFGPAAPAAPGEDRDDPSGPPVIQTQGEAVITVEPDMAELLIGVQTENPDAQTAVEKNAARADAVLKALRDLLGREADIKTVGYAVNPVYSTPRDGKSVIDHFRAENTIRVRTDQLKRAGEIVDRANKAGANTVGGVNFSLKDDAPARLKALGLAARDARTKADAIASALGVKIKAVLRAEETGFQPKPLTRFRAATPSALSASPTPIEAGTLEIRAGVMLTVATSP